MNVLKQVKVMMRISRMESEAGHGHYESLNHKSRVLEEQVREWMDRALGLRLLQVLYGVNREKGYLHVLDLDLVDVEYLIRYQGIECVALSYKWTFDGISIWRLRCLIKPSIIDRRDFWYIFPEPPYFNIRIAMIFNANGPNG